MRRGKYLHVVPPFYAFYGKGNLRQPNIPLGAAYCARSALSAGWNSLIWNGDLLPAGKENQYSEEMSHYNNYLSSGFDESNKVWDDLRDLLQDYKPDMLGISISTPAYKSAKHIVTIARQACESTKIIIGGPHPSTLPYESLHEIGADAVVVGEGEIILEQLLRSFCGGVHSSNYYLPLDHYAWPAKGKIYDRYGLIDRDNYGWIMFSRGCPFHCCFCGSHFVWTGKTRWRSYRDVVNEMLFLNKEYDTRFFSFEDDTFTLNADRVVCLCRTISGSGLIDIPGFRWVCNTRPELLNEKMLEAMKYSGCAAVAIGIESGNARILDKMRKGFTVEDVRRASQMIKDAGMVLSGQFMVGYPTETEDEMQDTVRLADELECESVMLSVATPLPKTPLYYEALELGLVDEHNIDWTEVTTKNDGILVTDKINGHFVPMHPIKRRKIIADIRTEFDKIQAKTQAAKEKSQHSYEEKYK